MINRSHRKAVSLLLVSEERFLNSGEQSFLDEHLKTCPECNDYARLHVRLKRDLKPQVQDLLPAGPPRSVTSSGIVSSIERKVKMRKMTNTVRRFARAGLAIVLLGAFLWVLFDLLPALTPGSSSTSGTPASMENPSLFSNTQPAISSQIVPTTTPEMEPSRTPPAKVSQTEVVMYIVQEGDTIFSIAEKFNLKPETIMWGNTETLGDNPHLLEPGILLNILPIDGIYYQWQEGDSLDEVAARTGVQPEDILNWPGNHLDPTAYEEGSPLGIQPGDMLVIPGGHRELIGPGFAEFSAPEWTSLGIRRETPSKGENLGIGFCEQSVSGAIGTGTFNWPVSSPKINGNDNHSVYLAGEEGDPVYASDSGVVLFAGWSNSHYGNFIIIDHGNGWQTSYGNLDEIRVGCGEYVSQGSQIGTIGSFSWNSGTDIRSGPTLQFEIIKDYTTGVNPLLYLPDP